MNLDHPKVPSKLQDVPTVHITGSNTGVEENSVQWLLPPHPLPQQCRQMEGGGMGLGMASQGSAPFSLKINLNKRCCTVHAGQSIDLEQLTASSEQGDNNLLSQRLSPRLLWE